MAPGSSLPTYVALLVTAASLTTGCVRWYESYPEDQDGGGARADAVKPPVPQPGTLNHAYETCATPMVIDAATIPSAGLVLALDFSQAQNDLGNICAPKLPELMIKLIHVTPGARLTLFCTGGGTSPVHYAFFGSACPLAFPGCTIGACANYTSETNITSSTFYLLVARPQTAPKATLTIKLGS